jgi:hypothetical protein
VAAGEGAGVQGAARAGAQATDNSTRTAELGAAAMVAAQVATGLDLGEPSSSVAEASPDRGTGCHPHTPGDALVEVVVRPAAAAGEADGVKQLPEVAQGVEPASDKQQQQQQQQLVRRLSWARS